uniref:Hydroxysteroid (17-beta) dehydrogenase 2 n=2 Tax=Salarias fasciatus TaxID=181472 RepID=A0A672G114_SALFA
MLEAQRREADVYLQPVLQDVGPQATPPATPPAVRRVTATRNPQLTDTHTRTGVCVWAEPGPPGPAERLRRQTGGGRMEVWSAAAAAAALLLVALGWRLRRGLRGVPRGLLRGLLWLLLWAALWAGAAAFTTCSLFLSQNPDLVWVLLLGGLVVCWEGEELQPDRTVLLTGCDSGFGHALAVTLSQRGLTVFAGVLDADGDGARRLRDRRCDRLQVLQLDVTDQRQVEAARSYVGARVADAGLWALVNNAGVLLCPADAELQPLDDYQRCLDVNFLSAVRMTQHFLPLLRRSGGRIVNVSSLAGNVPMPMFAAYGASKAALAMFSEVLRQEMWAWGVRVCVVQPTAFRTGIYGDSESASRHARRLLAAASAEAREDYGSEYIAGLPLALGQMSRLSAVDLTPVVDDVVHALLSPRPRPLYTPGHMGGLLPVLYRCCPTSWFDSLVSRLNYRKPAAQRQSSP